ncbi:MAG: hypothetical protein K5786_03725 [Treponema sp.]|nr:hypothetical protein [Treponema sp.]
MKKISLVLCACAVAMAGLLASCNNGPEEVVFVTEETTEALYDVSGSFTKTETSGLKDATTVTKTVDTITSGYAKFGWTSKTVNEADAVNYCVWDTKYNYKRVETVTPATGDATTTTYSEAQEDMWWKNGWTSAPFYTFDSAIGDGNNTTGFSKIDGKYCAVVQLTNWSTYKYMDVVNLTVTGDPETDNSFTVTMSVTDDNGSLDTDDDGVNDYINTKVYSYKLTFTKKGAN